MVTVNKVRNLRKKLLKKRFWPSKIGLKVYKPGVVIIQKNCLSFSDGNWSETLFWKNLQGAPLTNINRAISCHALNMLALCYLPGCIAAYIQLYRGTKYSRFPKILDRWLKMRKYLGLLMLFSACMHVRLQPICILFPT